MRVLMINPAWSDGFWSFPESLELMGRTAQELPLGLLTVAAMLPPEWPIEFVDEQVHDLTDEHWQRADVVFVGGLPSQLAGIFRITREGRRRGVRVVVGGSAIFHIPESLVQAGADVVVVGEAEAAMDELVRALEAGERGRILRDHDTADMAQSPPPRLDLVDVEDYVQMAIQTTRGCPFLCEFCDVTVMHGRKVRTKEVSQVLTELEGFRAAGWRGDLFFVDDIFNGNPGRARRIADAVAAWQRDHGYPFRFRTQCTVNLGAQPELLEAMVEAGFVDVFLGLESPDPASNERQKKFQNSRTDMDAQCQAIAEAGLCIFGGFIVGIDGEETGAGDRILAFVERNSIPTLTLGMLTAPHATDLWKRLEREGRTVWQRRDESATVMGSPLNFLPTRPADEICAELIRTIEGFYEPAAYVDRLLRNFERMRPRAVPWPALPMRPRMRQGFYKVFRGQSASGAAPNFVPRLRLASKRLGAHFERLVAHLMLYEHFHAYAQGIRAEATAMMAERAEALAEFSPSAPVPPPSAVVV